MTAALVTGDDSHTMDVDDRDLERMLALYRDACAEAGVEPLPDDEARELARAGSTIC